MTLRPGLSYVKQIILTFLNDSQITRLSLTSFSSKLFLIKQLIFASNCWLGCEEIFTRHTVFTLLVRGVRCKSEYIYIYMYTRSRVKKVAFRQPRGYNVTDVGGAATERKKQRSPALCRVNALRPCSLRGVLSRCRYPRCLCVYRN